MAKKRIDAQADQGKLQSRTCNAEDGRGACTKKHASLNVDSKHACEAQIKNEDAQNNPPNTRQRMSPKPKERDDPKYVG